MLMELAEGFTIIIVFIINIYAPTQTDIKHKDLNSTNSPTPNKLSYIYKTIFIRLCSQSIILTNRRKRTHWEVNMWAWTWIWLYHNRTIMMLFFFFILISHGQWSWLSCEVCYHQFKTNEQENAKPPLMLLIDLNLCHYGLEKTSYHLGVIGFLGRILLQTGHKHKCMCMIYANMIHHLINLTWPKYVSS